MGFSWRLSWMLLVWFQFHGTLVDFACFQSLWHEKSRDQRAATNRNHCCWRLKDLCLRCASSQRCALDTKPASVATLFLLRSHAWGYLHSHWTGLFDVLVSWGKVGGRGRCFLGPSMSNNFCERQVGPYFWNIPGATRVEFRSEMRSLDPKIGHLTGIFHWNWWFLAINGAKVLGALLFGAWDSARWPDALWQDYRQRAGRIVDLGVAPNKPFEMENVVNMTRNNGLW